MCQPKKMCSRDDDDDDDYNCEDNDGNVYYNERDDDVDYEDNDD